MYVHHPTLSLSTSLGFAQLSLSLFLLLTLLLTPPHWSPVIKDAPPNPAQVASPLSRLTFTWAEGRMWRWYRRSSKAEDSEFREYVPHLPDYLRSSWVLSCFRWTGDEESSEELTEAETEDDDRPSGSVLPFVWAFRGELVKTLAFAIVWIIFIFVSPLSMNLVSRLMLPRGPEADHDRPQLLSYVQDNTDTRFSPYVFAFGILASPIISSIAYQSAVYRLGQIGLRLRALLGHAVYKKLLRVKAGGGGSKEDDDEQESEGEEKKSGAGGAEAVGRVNSESLSS